MNILETIVAKKKKEIQHSKAQFSVADLEKSEFFERIPHELSTNFKKSNTGIIAEFKRKSPSKGIINDKIILEEVVLGYASAGAVAISVLTDTFFFGGTKEDLQKTRTLCPQTPLLRKDFIVEEYQILEAKAWGGDVILLIAACLTPKEIKELSRFSKTLGLSVLLEIHDEIELEKNLFDTIDCIGINNRNLKTFTVSLETSYDLVSKIPNNFVKITESGLEKAKDIISLRKVGFEGFLMGESFMKTPSPHTTFQNLVQELGF